MTTQNRYFVPAVGTAAANVGILGGNTVAMIAASFCNNTGNTVTATLYANTGSSPNCSYANNMTCYPNTTTAIFGQDQKHFLKSGDSLWVSCNVAGAIDFILSTAEGV